MSAPTQTITKVVFDRSVAIPANGVDTCREFHASGGWRFELLLDGIQLTHVDGRSYIVGGTGFVATVRQLAPVEEPAVVEERKLTLVKPSRSGDGKFKSKKGPSK